MRVEEQRIVVHGRVQPTRRRSRHGVGPQSARPRLPRQRRRDLSIDVNGSNDQWTHAVSQPFTQFYSVDVSEQDDSRLVGGAQDNGVNRSYGGTGWNTYVGGDGLEALIDPIDQNMVYGCSQDGVCARSTNGGDSTFDFTGATTSSRRNWLTPVQFDPANPAILYYAGNRIERSDNRAVLGRSLARI